ncbi:MAG: glycosyltransferase family 2 protein [Alphaproteobacteria bacterium]|nr:glycosyltransferase family 2 protein [Alphaproteobacteria bacterium]MBU1514587.1 glycosyltransferase family 2 protein [Alphaproteobacteria bacterium]MBU2096781.1 glycosyltransferase family 2 protein [Alphaproteobacteria bacterium]MBU2152495.1 glycosyltransferase family 2 protein [Alphaproteobacteria bacterium]MBU2306586.1 glycosyltransferase family 2 protein [Alphaproteobacteria bacterium]
MNSIAAPILASEPVSAPEFLRPRRSVSVVMVVFMTGEALEKSLACVLADPLVDELVVVDNGSTPAEAARLRALDGRDDRVRLLAGHGNVGFAKGANLGAAKAKGDLLVFLNPDAFLQDGCVAALAREIGDRPAPCIVGGRVLNSDGTEQRGARRGEITPMSAVLSMSGLAKGRSLSRYEVHWEGDALPDHAVATPTISGACFCMRREDFDRVGGFDEGYFLHVEDVDLCWRVRQAGGEVLFHPRAEVVHIGGTSQTSPLKVEFHKGVGLARYFRKRAVGVGQQAAAWALSPLVVIAAVVRPVLWRLTGRAG